MRPGAEVRSAPRPRPLGVSLWRGVGTACLSLVAVVGAAAAQGGSVLVTPDGATTPERQAYTGPYTADFTVKNTGPAWDEFSLGCSGLSGVTCAGLSQWVVGLAPNASAVITATYSVGAAGTGQLWLTAFSEETFAWDDGYYTVLIAAPPVVAIPPVVSPDGDTVLVFRGKTGLAQRFLVKNVDSTSHGYSLTKTCTGAASACILAPSSMTLAAGESGPATVTYQTNTSASGMVKLVATQTDQSAAKDSGWVPLRTVVAPAPVVAVTEVNPGTTVERGLCLTIAAGPAGAAECGDLRLIHPLPATRTLNTTRVPTLLYNSAHAAPYPIVAANVTVNSVPTTVEAILRVGGVQKALGQWSGSDWTTGSTRRIGLGFDAASYATGVYDYTLEVATLYPTRYATTVSGKLIIVNRGSSEFGSGWWLAGLERLYASGSNWLWVGGDGSARLYVAAGASTWVAANPGRPDTLRLVSGYYQRKLPGGVTIKFTTNGYHVQTVNRLNHVTTFAYDGSNRLTTITLPSQGGSQIYQFAYTGSWLDSIRAPALPSQGRNVNLTQTSGKVTQIRDPDNRTVGFTYSGNRIVSRTDRRSTTTDYGYDGAAKLWRVKTTLSASDSIRVGFYDAARRGFFNQTPNTAIDPASVYTILYGARTYATGGDYLYQETRFYLDRFGAPWKIRDAAGQWTTLARADAQYPALATRVLYANGRKLGAGYDAHGNVLFSTDSTNESGVATTRYAWDLRWDFATRVIPPEGDSVVMAYDTATGNRLWQQDARGSSSRVTYTYWGSGAKQGLLWKVDLPVDSGAYVYDYTGTRMNLTSATTPLGIRTRFVSDTIGRDTLAVVPIGNGADSTRTRTVYDIMGRVTETESYGPKVGYTGVRGILDTAAAGWLVVQNTYDAEGNLTNVLRYAEDTLYLTSSATTTTVYDRANRPVRVTNSGTDSTVYDPAGNPVKTITSRGYTITRVYDVLNRLIGRVVPQVNYAQAGCAEHGMNSTCGFRFPLYPNDGDSGLQIRADTATFTYDVIGNMTGASNAYAQVRRTYNKNGSVATDTLRLAKYNGLTFTSTPHVYTLTYGYDKDGRRTRLTHPSNLRPSGAVDQLYTYHPFGDLASVRDVKGYTYNFVYDVQARLDSLAYPGGWERYEYDADGRRIERTDHAGSATLQHDSFTYDQTNRISGVESSGAGLGWTVTNAYSGLGQVLMYDAAKLGTAEHVAEEYRIDGLGNTQWRKVLGESWMNDPEYAYAQAPLGHLTEIMRLPPEYPPDLWVPDTTYNTYDQAGQVRYSGWRQLHGAIQPNQTTLDWRASASFFAADGKLIVQQMYRDSVNYFNYHVKSRGVYEEHWYDALGRRVLTRRRADSLCTGGTSFCVSTLERVVWDGDQLLYELRAPGADSLIGSQLDATPPYSADYHQFGRVAYTHGAGIDAPLDLIRLDYVSGRDTVVIPHTGWRGEYGTGTNVAGVQVTFDIDWPANFRRAFLDDDPMSDHGLFEWFGGLIMGKQDQSGLMYMRNRYYDPYTGRFTQEDPIGLAGGLNLYGFAGGDPVNFGDPFGLCPDELKGTPKECDAWNQNRVNEAAAYYEEQRHAGNPGAYASIGEFPRYQGVNAEDLMLQANCGGGEYTVSGCTRVDPGRAAVIIVNADRLIPSIATTLAHESVHGVFGIEWEGLGQHVGRQFWNGLPVQTRFETAEKDGAGFRPNRMPLPWAWIPVP